MSEFHECADVSLGNDGRHYLAPIFAEGICCVPEIVPWNLGRNVVWDMHIDVMAQDFHPAFTADLRRHQTMTQRHLKMHFPSPLAKIS